MAGIDGFFRVASGAALSGALAFAPVTSAFENDESCVALMPVGHVGSGGVSSPQLILAAHRWSDSVGSISVSFDETMSAADQLAYARAELGVSVTDLAELLDVARPTVYSWMQGTEPRDEHLERLRRLERQVRDVEVYDLSGLSRLLKRPLETGNTLLDLLKAEQAIGAAMEELCAVARVEAEQRSARKGRQVTRTTVEAARDQSMPGYTSGA